jgi:fumarylacetoacetase
MTWLDLPADTGFGPTNLPYGVFSRAGAPGRVGVAIGEDVLDIAPVAERLAESLTPLLDRPVLNPLLAAGPAVWDQLRGRLAEWLTTSAHADVVRPHLIPLSEVELRLPFEVGDYVDFYASEQHATNLGRMFRPGSEPLTPNWKHLPIGYHGRSGTIVASGTPIRRPHGQRKAPDETAPTFGPSRRLDIEAELGFVVGVPSRLGQPVPVDAFDEHVFGVCLVNDWSARDIQAWEYVPLGPFLGKSFATSVSPWVVPLAALQDARVAPPPRDPPLLSYLRDGKDWGLDITLEVRLNGQLISRPPAAGLYWTAAQQLAHMTVNGASVRTGDLYASGTVSGPAPDQRGSLIELSWGGSEPIELADGTMRTFLEDGDTVSISATAPGPDGSRIAFGEVTGTVVPAA